MILKIKFLGINNWSKNLENTGNYSDLCKIMALDKSNLNSTEKFKDFTQFNEN